MTIGRELKKVSLEFRDLAGRVLKSDGDEARGNIRRLLRFVARTPLLHEEVRQAPKPSVSVADAWKAAQQTRNDRVDLPEDPQEELGFLHALLELFVSEDSTPEEFWQMCYGYAGATGVRECVSEVLDDIAGKYVAHLNRVLEIALLDSGDPAYDARRVAISISGGANQVNVAQEMGRIDAIFSAPVEEEILQLVRDLQTADGEIAEVADAVERELTSEKPRRFTLKAARTTLQDIAASTSAVGDIGSKALRLAELLARFAN